MNMFKPKERDMTEVRDKKNPTNLRLAMQNADIPDTPDNHDVDMAKVRKRFSDSQSRSLKIIDDLNAKLDILSKTYQSEAAAASARYQSEIKSAREAHETKQKAAREAYEKEKSYLIECRNKHSAVAALLQAALDCGPYVESNIEESMDAIDESVKELVTMDTVEADSDDDKNESA